MASTLVQCHLLALLASFLLCGIGPILAAPAHRHSRETDSCFTDCNVSHVDEEWHLLVGLLTTVRYTNQLSHEPNTNQLPSCNVDNTTKTLLGHLCDVLAYYDMAVKVDSNSVLQALLKQNALDAYTWLMKENRTNSNVTCRGFDADSPDQKLSKLRQYCLHRKLIANLSTESPVYTSTDVPSNFSQEGNCYTSKKWMTLKAEELPDDVYQQLAMALCQ